ncbi:MAG TPA: hypothetical protein VNG35_12110 [Gemmatimonadales bacterium]|nr:hypothetical protein [Gemmatimonadales bacterium]
MSVRPVTLNADGSIDVVYDERGHSGTVAAADVVWGTSSGGSADHNYIMLECPDGCGGASAWPVAGGAAAPIAQQMFLEKVQREGCPCGTVEAGRSDALPEGHVRLNCNRMDGPGRWQPAGAELLREVDPQAGKTSFQVIYQDTAEQMITGLEPSGGVGPDHKLAVLHDPTEYDVLMRTDPAYLSQDKAHILATPEVA